MTTSTRVWSGERPVRSGDLADWLLAHGSNWISLDEVAELLSISNSYASALVSRLTSRGELFSPTRGAYVPVPPEFRTWGVVPASEFIDPLMNHLGHRYYTGLLSAAEVTGAAHQRPQVFQVLTPARVRRREIGRVRIEFITDQRVPNRSTTRVNTRTGTMAISTPEITLLDLVSYPRHAGGLSNVTTIAAEYLQGDTLDLNQLAREARGYALAIVQRTGWILEFAGRAVGLDVNVAALAVLAQSRSAPTPLESAGSQAGQLDKRWNVILNTVLEPDL